MLVNVLLFYSFYILFFYSSTLNDRLVYIVDFCRKDVSVEITTSNCFVVVSAAVDGGKLIGYFDLPWFAWASAEMNLGDTVEYNTLVRVTSPYDRLATAIVKLFVYYNVRSIVSVSQEPFEL